jgi:hypothetical protein
MGPYGVLANEYVRNLSAAQFEEAPRRDTRAPREQVMSAEPRRRRFPRPRLRMAARAFREFAEVLTR